MVRGCESVIIEQSFAPFENHESAPFSSGKPGLKEYSVYSPSRDLVAIARVLGTDWPLCYVREAKGDHVRVRELRAAWTENFEADFPKPGYIWVKNLNPDRLQPQALRCRGRDIELLVYAVRSGQIAGNFDRYSGFRVEVTSEVPSRHPCGKESS